MHPVVADGMTILYLIPRPGLLIVSLGDGFNVTIQAYMTTITDPAKAAQVCSWMAMLGSAGTIAGRPVMMGVYQYGLRKSGSAHGLPYALSVVSRVSANAHIMEI
jgi:hypothetical protein